MSQRSRRVVGGVVICLLGVVAWRLDLSGESVGVKHPSESQTEFPQSAELANGAAVSVSITAPEDGAETPDGTITLQGTWSFAPPDEDAVSMVVALDLSGSAFTASGASSSCGDQNADGNSNQVLDCVLAALVDLYTDEGVGSVGETSVNAFAEIGLPLDLSPASGVQPWISPWADANTDMRWDVLQALDSARGVYSTNPGNPLVGVEVDDFTPRTIAAVFTDLGTSFGAAVDGACDLIDSSTMPYKRAEHRSHRGIRSLNLPHRRPLAIHRSAASQPDSRSRRFS